MSWKRTYWAVWVANLVTSIGMMSFLPFFPGHLRELGLTDSGEIAAWAGLIYGAAPLTAGFMMPIWGSFGDRFGRKAMVIRAMLAISLFVGLMQFAETPLQLFLLRVGQGLFSGFVAPSVTLVSVCAPPDRQGEVTGKLQTALALGSIAGPFFGGLLSAAVGVRGVFLWVAIGALTAALCVLFFAREDASHRQKVEEQESRVSSVLGDTWRDLKLLWRNPILRAALIATFFLQLSIGASNPLMELFVADLFESGNAALAARWIPELMGGDKSSIVRLSTSVLFGGMALTVLIGMPLWGRYGDRNGHSRTLAVSVALSGVALLLHAVAPFFGVLLIARLLLGAFSAGVAPSSFGIAASEVAVDRRGGAIGAVVSARTFAVSIGAMLGGQLASVIGIRGLFWIGAAIVLSSSAISAFAKRRGSSRSNPLGTPTSPAAPTAPPRAPLRAKDGS